MTQYDDSKAQALAARSRLMAQISAVRARIRPGALASDAKAAAGKQVIGLTSAALAQPKTRSIIALGAVSTGLAYLFRKPLLKALSKRLNSETDNEQ